MSTRHSSTGSVSAAGGRGRRKAQQPSPQRSTQPTAMVDGIDNVDTHFLQTLIGYNARRAALVVMEVFRQRLASFGLHPVDFSILSVVADNPGITARQLCTVLNIQPPNLVGKVSLMERNGDLERRPHPLDGRALGLYLTAPMLAKVREAEVIASQLEDDVAHRLNATEKEQLLGLLQKIYL